MTLTVILALWISGIIPKQIAKISATNYLKKNFPEKQYEFVNIEWSSSFGGYSILVINKNNYIGDSTKAEIEYARNLEKEIMYYTDLMKEN